VNKEIGERIRAIRIRKKLSPKDIGAEIGMLDTSYSKIERGGNTTVETILKIAEALDVNPAEFFEEVRLVAEPLAKAGYATKDDLEILKRMIESIAKEVNDRLPPKKSTEKKYSKKKP
jgi:transcriptional regulator with XRE-family HTH domain